MKYHQTVQGDEIRNFYTSKGQPETKRYIITVHFWFSKVVLGISHILNLIFKITLCSPNFHASATYHRTYTEYYLGHHSKNKKHLKLRTLIRHTYTRPLYGKRATILLQAALLHPHFVRTC